MSIYSLIAAGAADVASAYLSRWVQAGGRRLTERVIQGATDAIRRRVGGELSASDLRQARRIVEASREAQLAAARLDNADARRLRPSEIPIAPGSDARSRRYSYVVKVTVTDIRSGYDDTFTVEIRDERLLTGDEVRARAVRMASQGEIRDDYKNKVRGLGSTSRADAEILTVYRGSPRG
jgi:hypothetical protein